MTGETNRKPTSFDVARRAGVSRSAVSRAFTPGAAVAEDTRKKVLAAAEELGYRVNSLARGLQGDHSGIVGVLASRLDTPVRARQVQLLAQSLIRDGFRPMLVTAENPDDVAGLFDTLLGYSVAGVVVTSDTPPQSTIEACRKTRVPVVLINRDAVVGWGDRVISSPDRSGQMALCMLRSSGATRFGVLEPQGHTFSVTGRANAFKEAAGACVCLTSKDQSYSAARAAVSAVGRAEVARVDGLFCATDLMAIGALDGLRLDLGLNVPKDIQVVGFDDIEQASWGAYDLSTVRQDLEAQADIALDLLKSRTETPDLPIRTEFVPLTPIYRSSTKS